MQNLSVYLTVLLFLAFAPHCVFVLVCFSFSSYHLLSVSLSGFVSLSLSPSATFCFPVYFPCSPSISVCNFLLISLCIPSPPILSLLLFLPLPSPRHRLQSHTLDKEVFLPMLCIDTRTHNSLRGNAPYVSRNQHQVLSLTFFTGGRTIRVSQSGSSRTS